MEVAERGLARVEQLLELQDAPDARQRDPRLDLRRGGSKGCMAMSTRPIDPMLCRKTLLHHSKGRTPALRCETEKTSNQTTGSRSCLGPKKASAASATSTVIQEVVPPRVAVKPRRRPGQAAHAVNIILLSFDIKEFSTSYFILLSLIII